MEMIQICKHLELCWFITISISFGIEQRWQNKNTHLQYSSQTFGKKNEQALTETAMMKQINIVI